MEFIVQNFKDIFYSELFFVQLYLPTHKASLDSIIYVNSLTKLPCRIVIHY